MKNTISSISILLMVLSLSCNNNETKNEDIDTAKTIENNTSSNTATTTNPITALSLTQVMEGAAIPKDKAAEILKSGKLVLVDFWAPWCGPCRQLKPSVEAISKEMKDKVILLEINVDDHKELATALRIEGIPLLHVYKNDAIVWSNTGLVPKEFLQQEIGKL